MAETKDNSGDRLAALSGYLPNRPAKLRSADVEPPPVPSTAYDVLRGFGGGDEDGLRMIAALETMTSLEPDYSDDLTAEASVTIIETAGDDVGVSDRRPLRYLLDETSLEPELLLNGYETFLGPGDEASVEIVEVPYAFGEPEPASVKVTTTHPSSLAERLAAATGASGRFLKALSGG